MTKDFDTKVNLIGLGFGGLLERFGTFATLGTFFGGGADDKAGLGAWIPECLRA